jgi:hypothetical protein
MCQATDPIVHLLCDVRVLVAFSNFNQCLAVEAEAAVAVGVEGAEDEVESLKTSAPISTGQLSKRSARLKRKRFSFP